MQSARSVGCLRGRPDQFGIRHTVHRDRIEVESDHDEHLREWIGHARLVHGRGRLRARVGQRKGRLPGAAAVARRCLDGGLPTARSTVSYHGSCSRHPVRPARGGARVRIRWRRPRALHAEHGLHPTIRRVLRLRTVSQHGVRHECSRLSRVLQRCLRNFGVDGRRGELHAARRVRVQLPRGRLWLRHGIVIARLRLLRCGDPLGG